MRLKSTFLLLAALLAKVVISQTSGIKGKVIDEKTGETLPGAVVMIEGTTTGGNTDLDGNFSISNLQEGTYRLVCKLISYNTKILDGVKVSKDEPTVLTIALQTASTDLGVVEVTTTVSKETTTSLLILQKNNASVSDGVSSESIKRTPDKSTSDVLKRVSGASIQDNKFAIIRGLNDRYNAAFINGAPLPSSESDRKAFAFDIFPSNMLDNLVIIKTATPDLPAEFAGGIIQINTKSIPEEDFQSLSIGAAYNTMTTGKQQIYYNGGKLDFIGVDDGSRAISSAIPNKDNFPLTISDQAKLAKETDFDWSLHEKKFSPNYNFQYAMGTTTMIRKTPLGIVLAMTYNRSNNFTETIRRGYTGNGSSNGTVASQIDYDYLDKTYSEQTLGGLLGNLSWKANDNNTLSFKNLYSTNADDRVIARSGETNPLESNPTLLRSTARWFTSNQIYAGQLSGDHLLPASKIRINWTGALSSIKREIPNLRRSIYTRLDHFNDPSDPNPLDTTYTANISYSNVGPDYGGGMFWSENKENIYSIKADASRSFKSSKDLQTDVKIGGFYQQRSRIFYARQLGYTKYGVLGGNVTFKDSLLYEGENDIFSAANLGLITPPSGGANGVGGFKLTDGTKYSDNYTASSNLTAAYVMLDNRYKFARLVWGARLENFSQKLNATKSDRSPLALNQTKLDVLPSANLICSINDKQNLRLSYSQTLNRPEYRELAPFAFYDFNTSFVISGNDSLQRALIHNLDVRWEIYPGRGQMASASVFYKKFIDPIEQLSRADVINEISFANVPEATNYGVELEFRVLLGALFKADSSKLLNNLTLYSNLAVIRSAVDVSNVTGSASKTRPLQGQSPYVWNAGLQYLDRDLGMSFSASFNKVAPRIAIVGNVVEPDIWEKGRAFLDLQVSKSFLKNKLEVKVNAQNLLAQNQDFYQNRDMGITEDSQVKGFFNSILTGDKNNKNGFNPAEDDLIWSTKSGRVFSLAISYKF